MPLRATGQRVIPRHASNGQVVPESIEMVTGFTQMTSVAILRGGIGATPAEGSPTRRRGVRPLLERRDRVTRPVPAFRADRLPSARSDRLLNPAAIRVRFLTVEREGWTHVRDIRD